ncbi:tetratricopeptide repeat protein, partial [Pyxidicoccus sp. 3LG]
MSANLECPECRGAVAGNDFQCGNCGLLLDADQASGEYVVTEPTIVRALLSPPQRTRTLEVPQPPPPAMPTPHDLATARFTVPMDAHTVPHLRAGLDIALQPLHPFEAHIASFIDGVQPVPELARAARLHEIEVKVVLKGLLERGVVELHRMPGAPDIRSLTEELPVLDGNDFLMPEPMALGDEEPPPPPPRAPPSVPAR